MDGEACIHLAKIKRTCGNGINYRLRIAVSQNCQQTLIDLQSILGGGSIYKIQRKLEHTRQIFTLVLDGRFAIEAIRAVEPFLRRKQFEAQVAMKYYDEGMPSLHPGCRGTPDHIWAKRKWCYDKLRKMK